MWFDWFYGINSLRRLQLQLPVSQLFQLSQLAITSLLWSHIKFMDSAAPPNEYVSHLDPSSYQIKCFLTLSLPLLGSCPHFLLFSINFNLLFLHFINFPLFRLFAREQFYNTEQYRTERISICPGWGRKINYTRSYMRKRKRERENTTTRYNCHMRLQLPLLTRLPRMAFAISDL